MDRAVRLCECHGLPVRGGGLGRGCRVKMNEARKRYNRSPKGKASSARYRKTAAYRATQARYEARRIRVSVAGISENYLVRPERRDELVAKLADFRARQREEARSVK